MDLVEADKKTTIKILLKRTSVDTDAVHTQCIIIIVARVVFIDGYIAQLHNHAYFARRATLLVRKG